MHKNFKVRDYIVQNLSNQKNVSLVEPLQYDEFVFVMKNSFFIMTDSGGIQEEAPAFGKPVLILRNETERPEAIDAGSSKLVGTNQESIYNEANKLLNNKKYYEAMAKSSNPFGDGTASLKILSECKRFLNEK